MASTKKPDLPKIAALSTGAVVAFAIIGFLIGYGSNDTCKLNKPCTMNMGNYKQPVLPVKASEASDTKVIIDGKSAPVVAVPVSSSVEAKVSDSGAVSGSAQ